MRKFTLSGFRLSTALLFVLSFVVLVNCEGVGGPSVGGVDYKEYLKKPHYKVFISATGTVGDVWCYRWAQPSAQVAVNEGLKRCEEYRLENFPLGVGVELFAIGDIEVWAMTDKQLKKAIEVYQNNPNATNADLSSRKKEGPAK